MKRFLQGLLSVAVVLTVPCIVWFASCNKAKGSKTASGNSTQQLVETFPTQGNKPNIRCGRITKEPRQMMGPFHRTLVELEATSTNTASHDGATIYFVGEVPKVGDRMRCRRDLVSDGPLMPRHAETVCVPDPHCRL